MSYGLVKVNFIDSCTQITPVISYPLISINSSIVKLEFDIKKQSFKNLREIDTIIEKYKKIIPQIKNTLEDEYRTVYYKDNDLPSSLLVGHILEIDNPKALETSNLPPDVKEFIKANLKKDDLLKPKKNGGS
jgi:hypothetical protein